MLSKLFKRKPAAPTRLTIEPLGRSLEMAPGQTLLEAALAAGVAFPYSCKVGTCTSCKCRLVEGDVRAVRDFSYALTGEELRSGYVLACQSVPKGDVRIHVAHERSGPTYIIKSISGVVSGARPLACDVVELTLRLHEPMLYEAGQYADLLIDGIDRPRSYSFASAPLASGRSEVAFHVRLVPGGKVSDWIAERDRAGEPVRIIGPYGTFWLREAPNPILCVAGSTGMAPITAILEKAAAAGGKRSVVYLYGARTTKHLYHVEHMRTLEKTWPGSFRFVPVLSEEPQDTEWRGARGLVTEHIALQGLELPSHHVYLCGPPGMIDAAIVILRDAGVPSDAVHFDKFLDESHLAGLRVGYPSNTIESNN